MKELKKYDEQSEEFQKCALSMKELGSLMVSRFSLNECVDIIEKTKENVSPMDLLPFLHPFDQFKELINGFINIHNGDCTKEEGLLSLIAFIKKDVRQAMTQSLAGRKTQRA